MVIYRIKLLKATSVLDGDSMGIFDRFYYGKAGKRDYSEADMPTNRIALFFLVLKDHLFDLVKVNLLQLVFWLPLIIWSFLNLLVLQGTGNTESSGSLSGYLLTWLVGLIPCIAITGPSSAGAAYIMRNWAKDQHAFLFSDFKDAFKSNWKQALSVSTATGFLPVVLYAALTFYGGMAKHNPLLYVPLAAAVSAGLIVFLMLPLVYPMMIGYELRLRDILKNAFLMSAAQFPKIILVRLIMVIPVAAILYGVYSGRWIVLLCGVLYYCIIGFALSRLVFASLANDIFDIYLNPRIQGVPVREGLRPQDWEDEQPDDEDDEE